MFRRRLIPAFILILLLISVALADSDWECRNCKRKVPEDFGHICPYCGEANHVWNPATCTEPETCSCGEKQGEPLGHAWQDASCTEPKKCMRCGKAEGEPLGHDWLYASCTEPMTCARCGQTEGEPLGHAWQEATCTEPQKCTRCGKKQGEPLGHAWQEASCTEPVTCIRCGKTEGEPLGHAWQEASYTDPKKCTRCGITEGEPLGQVIATAKVTLYFFDPVSVSEQKIRSSETNLGDLCADAFRYRCGADIAIVNSGAIRAQLDPGGLITTDFEEVLPFNNHLTVIEASGQQILDALEWSVHSVPEPFFGFLQVSGITFEVNVNIESPVIIDGNGKFAGVDQTKQRRVSNVMVGSYQLQPEKTYSLASADYILLNGGDSYTMFIGCSVLQNDEKITSQVLIDYVVEELGGVINIGYQNPDGMRRIILN